MSKAEEKAWEKYTAHSVLIVPARGGGYYADSHLREGFIEGYHQAEKDLELTWDDISVLNCLLNEVEHEFKKGVHEDKSYIGYCKEVLKRFKNFKEREEN